MLNTFKQFIEDPKAFDMFVTGQAGTGKTTGLAELVEYCKANEISIKVCAYTHKACEVLRQYLPEGTDICTLHSFLKKRPGVNDQATMREHISISSKRGKPEDVPMVLAIDEYSTIGEKDFMDIGLVQDPNYEGLPVMKVLYIGDPNQLPPVGDTSAIIPNGKYQVVLKEIHRQKDGNGLLEPLCQLVDFMNGAKPKPLKENKNFIRGIDIVAEYKNCKTDDKVILAYTNEVVESLNADIKGKTTPMNGDGIFSPSMKEFYTFDTFLPLKDISYISLPFGEDLYLKSKYKTLEHLLTMHDQFALIINEEGEYITHAIEFGHYQYKLKMEEYGEAAVKTNKIIEDKHGMGGKTYAKIYPHDPLSRARAKAWRNYLTYRDCVICIDFPFAMTVHKSQGSTFDTVFVDTENLGICANKDYQTYLKLMYVAISRASNKVYTN